MQNETMSTCFVLGYLMSAIRMIRPWKTMDATRLHARICMPPHPTCFKHSKFWNRCCTRTTSRPVASTEALLPLPHGSKLAAICEGNDFFGDKEKRIGKMRYEFGRLQSNQLYIPRAAFQQRQLASWPAKTKNTCFN